MMCYIWLARGYGDYGNYWGYIADVLSYGELQIATYLTAEIIPGRFFLMWHSKNQTYANLRFPHVTQKSKPSIETWEQAPPIKIFMHGWVFFPMITETTTIC